MANEPDIVKELRTLEKINKLQCSIQSLSKEQSFQNEPKTNSSKKTTTMYKNGFENTKRYDEIVSFKERYQTIFDNYSIAITLADNNERIISWNKYTEELLNMNETDLYNRSVKSLYPLEEWKKIRKENIRRKGIKHHLETKMVKNNQDVFDVEVSLCVLRGKNEEIAGSVGIIKDISELKKTENALKESEEKYHTIFENSAVALMLADEKERIISWNKYAEKLLGLGPNDLYLKPVETLYPVDEWKKIRSENIRKKGLQHHMETRIYKNNNEVIDIDLSLSVLKNHHGKLIGSIGVIKDISARKNFERNLRLSEKKFKQLYENAPIPYHTISKEGIITDINEKWCQILGYSKQEVIGKSIFDFIISDEEEVAESSFKSKINKKLRFSEANERTFVTKSGEKRIFVVQDFFAYDKKENLSSINTILVDITTQKQIEDDLKLSEKRFKDMALCSADWIWEIDKEGKYTFASGRVHDIIGYTPEELIGKTPFELMPKDEADRIGKIYKENASKKQNIVDLENWNLSKKGERICLLTNGVPIFNEAGVLTGYRGVDKDITEKKKIEENLKKSREHFKKLFNIIVDPVVIVDSKGKFLEITNKVEEITGFKKEELIGKNFLRTQIVTRKSKALLIKNLVKRMGGFDISPYEVEVLTKDGRKLPFEVNACKIDYLGMPADMVIFRDITERKKAQEDLQVAHKELKMMNEKLEEKVNERTMEIQKLLVDKDEFINQLGHDLKNPLTPLVNLLPIIEDSEKDPEIKDMFEVINRNVRYMKNLVVKTIELARLNSPNIRLNFENINLHAKTNNVIGINKILFDEKNIKVINNISEDIQVSADKLLLGEVFNNIISNSVKYSNGPGIITIDAKSDDEYVTVSISDTGIGMTNEQLSHVFDEFYKADESRHDFDSSGLGMSICKRIVEKHRGCIWAESPGPGKGSTFYFTIPRNIISSIAKKDTKNKIRILN